MTCLLKTLRIGVLLALLLVQAGCATSDADLDYTREKPADPAADNSYHGWNSANN
jgi:hypothetical protein